MEVNSLSSFVARFLERSLCDPLRGFLDLSAHVIVSFGSGEQDQESFVVSCQNELITFILQPVIASLSILSYLFSTLSWVFL